jgi:hypothetical protein
MCGSVGLYELLIKVIRSSEMSAADVPEDGGEPDPLFEEATRVFADMRAERVPSIQISRARFHVRQSRAQRVRARIRAQSETG